MTAKQWLHRARTIDKEIEVLLDEKQQTLDRLLQITQSYTRSEAQTSKDPHKIDKLIEYEDKIDRKVDELAAVKQEIGSIIDLLEDDHQRIALRGYYLAIKTWEQVAVDMNYSFQGVMLIRKKAIEEVEKILNRKILY